MHGQYPIVWAKACEYVFDIAYNKYIDFIPILLQTWPPNDKIETAFSKFGNGELFSCYVFKLKSELNI